MTISFIDIPLQAYILGSTLFILSLGFLYFVKKVILRKIFIKHLDRLNLTGRKEDFLELSRKEHIKRRSPPIFLRLIPLYGIDFGFKSKKMRLLFERSGWIYAKDGDVYLKYILLIVLVLATFIFYFLNFLSSDYKFLPFFYKAGLFGSAIMTIALGFKPYLESLAKKKQKAMEPDFLDFCDVFLIALNSGLSIEAAIKKINMYLTLPNAQLKDLLTQLEIELEFMKFQKAFRNFYDRFQSDIVRDFLVIVFQSKQQGSSVIEGLSSLVDQWKNNYILEMEDQAQKIPLKITFITAIFFFPTFFIFILAPLFIKML